MKALPPPASVVSIYPDAATLQRLDTLAAKQERKRSPMAVIALKRGLDIIEKEAKSK